MIESERLYTKLNLMTSQEREEILDPICEVVRGKIKLENGLEVLANRIFALAVLELYEQWQIESYNKD